MRFSWQPVRAAFAIALAGMLSACAQAYPPKSYRLTLTFRESGRDYTGSSVVHVRSYTTQTIDDGVQNYAIIQGQATVVKLGDGRMVFGLLETFGPGGHGQNPIGFLDGGTGPITLISNQMPEMIVFRDLANPSSYEYVWPDNAAATLGPGVGFVRATLSISTDPITRGIYRDLPWLSRTWTLDANIITGAAGCDVNPAKTCVFKHDLVEGE